MIKSLKVSNGAFASFGAAQVQPVTSDLGFNIKAQVTQATHIASPAVLPAYQAAIATPVMFHSPAEFKLNTNLSIHSIASSLISDRAFLLPPYHGIFNYILPSFALNLEPSTLGHPVSDSLVVTPKKFEPYEQLTGISHERPEIVMLTNFLPLFTKDVSHSQPSFIHLVENGGIYPFMTDAGRFVDTHLQARNLRNVNMIQLLRVLRSRYSYMGWYFTQRKRAFEKNTDALRDSANFLLELVRSLERLKAQLDLRDDLHIVDPHSVVNYYFLNFTRINSLATSNILFDFIRRYLPVQYTVPDALVRLGYTSDNVLHNFSSSKIWLQLLLELKSILEFHSAEFIDIDPVTQRRDSNAVALTRLTTPRFGLRTSIPALPPLSELTTLAPSHINVAVNTLNQAWQVLYQDVHFKTNEAHIAALANMASKEFRYSYGLSLPDVKQSLADQFSYSVTPADNAGVFESIIGKFGNNITDFPATQTNSLANLAQRQPSENVAVLTFESKYVDGDTGTLTPGGSFYVDQVLKTDGQTFDVSRLDELGNLFEKSHKQFSTVVNGMNMLATRVYDPYDRTHTQFSSIMSSPVDLVQEVVRNLLDTRTGNTLPQAVNDNLGAVYSFAAQNNRVKSALFMFTMARATRLYSPVIPFFSFTNFQTTNDNTPLTDALINNVIDTLAASVPQTLTGNQFIISQFFHVNKKFPTLSRDTIRASMKSGTVLTRFIESTMQQVLGAFRSNGHAMSGDHTRFNGDLDTTIMMVVFDTILQMVARYNNQTVISANSGHTLYNQGTLTFNISRTTTNHRASYNDLITRLEKEVALTHKLIYTVMNSLQKLSGAFKNYSNYLKSPPALDKLREISSILNDPTLLQMLMSEQQIMMLASTVHDLVDRISQYGVTPDSGDADGDGDFDADDELKVLDDSVVMPQLRNAVYGMFGTQEFDAKKGYNKKILTVGVPLGFTRRLKQRVNINNLKKSTFVDKQNDIVQVVVYKVDLQNSDIVYKPKRLLFELSRFPVRNDRYFLGIPEKPTMQDIVHAIPTRDFGQSQAQASEVTYWSLNTDDINRGRKAAFADESYSFLSQQQKQEIIHNHVSSYLLEVYTRLTTGVSLADYHFDLVEPPKAMESETIKLITEHHVAHVTNLFNVQKASAAEFHAPTGGVLFSSTAARNVGYTAQQSAAARASTHPQYGNPAGIAGSVSHATQFGAIPASPVIQTAQVQESIGSLSTNMSAISHRNVPVMLHGLRTISNLSHMITPLADPLAVSKRIVAPKQFDRVFNVIVDPDEFEIDYAKTVKTPHGRQALQQMIQKGDIIPETENYFYRNSVPRAGVTDLYSNPIGRPFIQNRLAPNFALFRFRDRDKNQGDLTFEKYFVTVETYGEDEV